MRSERTTRIIAAIKNGAVTSPVLAEQIGISRPLMSVTLHHLAECGMIVRSRGHHPIRWRLAPEASP